MYIEKLCKICIDLICVLYTNIQFKLIPVYANDMTCVFSLGLPGFSHFLPILPHSYAKRRAYITPSNAKRSIDIRAKME